MPPEEVIRTLPSAIAWTGRNVWPPSIDNSKFTSEPKVVVELAPKTGP